MMNTAEQLSLLSEDPLDASFGSCRVQIAPAYRNLVAPRTVERWFRETFELRPEDSAKTNEPPKTDKDKDSIAAARGRSKVAILESESVGSVVVRGYFRGGLVRRISTRTYLSTPWSLRKTRPFRELQTLVELHSAGVSVAEPIAACVQPSAGGFAYQGCIVTKRVEGAVNLLTLLSQYSSCSTSEAEQLFKVIIAASRTAGEQARKAIDRRIVHVDLHPGNVLLDERARAVVIDFDKARDVRIRSWDERDLISRWGRSLKKWNIRPSVLMAESVRAFSDGLLGSPQ